MIDIDFQDLDKLRKQFDPKVVNRALNSAINKTANKARTFISKKIREKYNVKAATIKHSLSEIRRKDPKDLVAERVLQYTGPHLVLSHFGARVARIPGSRHKGASVLVRKDRGRKIVKGRHGYGGFIIVDKKYNHLNVYERETKERYPIDALFGPSVAEMISATETFNAIDAFVGAEMPKQLEHELDYFLGKAGAI
jgi:hypothetical protein